MAEMRRQLTATEKNSFLPSNEHRPQLISPACPPRSRDATNPKTTSPATSSPVLQAPHERRVLDAPARVPQPRDGPVVAEARELVLHRLREHRPVDVRVLWLLRREVGVEVGRVEGVGLEHTKRR